MHIVINHKTHEIVAVTLTESNVHDSMETESLLRQVKDVASFTGDKGYDNKMPTNQSPSAAHEPSICQGMGAP